MSTMTNTRHRQKGLSSLGWLAAAGIFGILSVGAIKVIPIYMENFTIKSVLEAVQEDPRIDPKSKRAIWESISKRLYINEVRLIKREHVTMTRKDGKTTITITYESRRPYMGNLFIGGAFSESVVIDR
ncbi:MAG: DUF4845 domain-containing protein [Proteobacteria bacterium]|nr:DUF4845 domain-containing protein [Pseudomonadota bacterium]